MKVESRGRQVDGKDEADDLEINDDESTAQYELTHLIEL